MKKTFKYILNHISPYGNELTIKLYLVSKDSGKIVVCDKPIFYDYRKYNLLHDFEIHTEKYSFKLNNNDLNKSKLPRERTYGYYNQYREVTHYLFIDKDEAVEYSNDILTTKIKALQHQRYNNKFL